MSHATEVFAKLRQQVSGLSQLWHSSPPAFYSFHLTCPSPIHLPRHRKLATIKQLLDMTHLILETLVLNSAALNDADPIEHLSRENLSSSAPFSTVKSTRKTHLALLSRIVLARSKDLQSLHTIHADISKRKYHLLLVGSHPRRITVPFSVL